MEGFKVTCLKCGKVTTITETQDNYHINIFGGQDSSAAIMCDCDNRVECI
ncbi:hypothetical protein ACEPPU_24015 [Priestia aryabhattai]